VWLDGRVLRVPGKLGTRIKIKRHCEIAETPKTCYLVKRADAQHKASTQIARKAALIGIEDLNLAGMLKNRKLARALSDASLSEFQRHLRYKAAWHGGRLVAIDRFYPSSKIHNGCGGYKADLDLSDRLWTCEACGEQVDRDLNAARNIRDEALRVSASPVVATSG
jgi:putative transposase